MSEPEFRSDDLSRFDNGLRVQALLIRNGRLAAVWRPNSGAQSIDLILSDDLSKARDLACAIRGSASTTWRRATAGWIGLIVNMCCWATTCSVGSPLPSQAELAGAQQSTPRLLFQLLSGEDRQGILFFSRPRLGNDNPFSQSLVALLKMDIEGAGVGVLDSC